MTRSKNKCFESLKFGCFNFQNAVSDSFHAKVVIDVFIKPICVMARKTVKTVVMKLESVVKFNIFYVFVKLHA